MTQWALWGTLVDTAAIIFGALLGLSIRALTMRKQSVSTMEDGFFDVPPSKAQRVVDTAKKGLGLCVTLIGISGALKIQLIPVMIVSVVLGGIVGELLNLDGWLTRFGAFMQKLLGGKSTGNIAEGFISTILACCVGAMTFMGALESGLYHTHEIYYAKALLDLLTAVVFAMSMGSGVLLSAAGIFAVQSVLTLIVVIAGTALPMTVASEMMAVGSLLLITIGMNMVGATKIKVMNFVPAMFFPIVLYPLFSMIFA